MKTINIICASTSEQDTPYWSKSVRATQSVFNGTYPVLATIDVDDQFVQDDERAIWYEEILRRWTILAGCEPYRTYGAIVDDRLVASVVAGQGFGTVYLVVRGDNACAQLVSAGMAQDGFLSRVLWHRTEEDAAAAKARYLSELARIAEDEKTPADKAERAIASLNVRVVESGDGWDWPFEQYIGRNFTKIVGDRALPHDPLDGD